MNHQVDSHLSDRCESDLCKSVMLLLSCGLDLFIVQALDGVLDVLDLSLILQ